MTTIKVAKTSKGDIETLASFRRFRLDFSRLHRLYDNSIYAYQETRESIYKKINSLELERDALISFKSLDKNNFIISKAQGSAHRFRSQYPKHLRELIFIRLISALEVFLIDSISEAFLINKNLLKPEEDGFLRLSENEFLSYSSIEEAFEKYIERKCRDLHGQGYEAIKKFYLKNVRIDLTKSKNNSSKISIYHDKRHLLVHRLGKTDSQYRHKYSTDDKSIRIEENYLLEAFDEINNLTFYINKELIDLVKIT